MGYMVFNFLLFHLEFTHMQSYEHSEVIDSEEMEESEESMEPHRNMILSILSQLKLGMDLTRVGVWIKADSNL